MMVMSGASIVAVLGFSKAFVAFIGMSSLVAADRAVAYPGDQPPAAKQLRSIVEELREGSNPEETFRSAKSFLNHDETPARARRALVRALSTMGRNEHLNYFVMVMSGDATVPRKREIIGTVYHSYYNLLYVMSADSTARQAVLRMAFDFSSEKRTPKRWVTKWAVEKACDQGHLEFSEDVKRKIQVIYHERDREPKTRICEKKMEYLGGGKPLVSSLETLLMNEDPYGGNVTQNILRWALEKLDKEGSDEAMEVIASYLKRVQQLPERRTHDPDYEPMYYLRKNGWRDSDLRARGIVSKYLLEGK